MTQATRRERPWWLRWDGVPPSYWEGRRRPLGPRAVWVNRAIYVAWAISLAALWARYGFPAPLPSLGALLVSLIVMPFRHRRQLFGLEDRPD